MPTLKNAASAALLTLLVASSASAALSPKYTEWRNGPVQWIMTGSEKNAWKQVKSDEDAVRFIDLFWVRRDRTPGTAENEVRDEHLAREMGADQRYAEPRKRGSLTERGRAWYVLGAPPNLQAHSGRVSAGGAAPVAAPAASQSRGGGAAPDLGGKEMSDPAGGRQLGARDVWIWEHDAATAAFGLPRVEIVFVTDPITRRTTRDLQRRDYAAAEGAVLRKQIVSDYQTLPEWAAFGGLEPRSMSVRIAPAPAAVVQPNVTPQPAEVAIAPVPAVPMAPRGASRLILLQDAYSISTQTAGDPFADLRAVQVFKKGQELGWVAQYCAASDQELSVPFMLHITGNAGGNAVDRATAPDELVPDRIKASPGCSMIRGSLPLDDFQPGTYRLELMIDDPIVKSDSYTLKSEFTVE